MPSRSKTGARPRSSRPRSDTRGTKRPGVKKVPTAVKRTSRKGTLTRRKTPPPARRSPTRAPAPRTLTRSPALWWREPLKESALADASPGEREVLIAQERALKTEQLKERIQTLRKYSTAFEASDGYSLRTSDIVRLPASKLKKVERAFQALRRAQSHPHVEFVAKSDQQRIAAKRRAGEILPGQKRFLIHHGDARLARAEWVDGDIQITTSVKGGEIYERIYLFPKRPRSWPQVVRQTQALMRRGMRTGNYKILNSLYGAIGELVSIDKLEDSLEQFYSTYSRWLAGTILGWVWMGTSLDEARTRQRKQKTQAERFQEQRKMLQQRESDRMRRRLGMKVPKRQRRIVFYVLYQGSVVSRRYDTRKEAEQYISRALWMSRGAREASDYEISERYARVRGATE